MAQKYLSIVIIGEQRIGMISTLLTKKRLKELGKEYGFPTHPRDRLPKMDFRLAEKPAATGLAETVIIYRVITDTPDKDSGFWSDWWIYHSFGMNL